MGKYRKELVSGAVLLHSFPVTAAFPISATTSPRGGSAGKVERIESAHYTHMNKKTVISGGSEVKELLAQFRPYLAKGYEGDIPKTGKLNLSLSWTVSDKWVKAGANPNADDKDKALASMSEAEKAAVARYNMLCASFAQDRASGMLARRVSLSIEAEQV